MTESTSVDRPITEDLGERMGPSFESLSRDGRKNLGRRAILAAGILAGLVVAAQPSAVFAHATPPWDPGHIPWAPIAHPASPEMREISDLFWVMLVLSGIVFFGVAGVMIINIVRFSERPGREASQIRGSRPLEVSWTAVPFVVLVLAFAITVRDIHDINTLPKGGAPLNIDVIGHQWWWEFRYPSLHVITADEVHVPVNTPIHFHVESADVIHSFWAPQLTRQIDANPGQDNAVFARLDTPGIYDGMCYEYCGSDHAWMKYKMIVQPVAQFKAWARAQVAPEVTPHGLAAAGQKVFLSNTCVECHAITGTTAGGTVAPNLTHVGSRWTIGAGAAPMDLSDMEAWIRDPNTYKPGVNMPGYPLLSSKDLRALATYLVGLK